MYYVIFDDSNKINGFFNDAINSLIPQEAIPISDEKWQELSANPQNYVLQDGEIILLETQPQAQPSKRMNWGEFNRAMQANEAYNQLIIEVEDRESVRRLESLCIALGVAEKQSIQDIDLLWNTVVSSLPSDNNYPTSMAIAIWNEIAANTGMPFRFGNDLKMEVTE